MKTATAPEPGMFCWIELATSDPKSAKSFYQSLVGWASSDTPMGPGGVYTTFEHDGAPAGGAYQLTPEMSAAGLRPHWLLYVATADVDDAGRRVSKLGGEVVRPMTDVADLGRMAVVRDPTGAMFALWQSKRPIGFVSETANTFCWADLNTPDPAKASAFYRELFDWKLWTSPKDSSGYLHISLHDHPIGGIPPHDAPGPNLPPHWLIWLAVDECDAAVRKIGTAGGAVLAKPQSMPNVGRFAVVADPQGAAFGIITPERH